MTHSHKGEKLDLWTAREETDGELSNDDEIQDIRKMLMRFSDEDRLFEEELYQLSQNIKAKWDRDEPNEGYVSEYEDSSDLDSLAESGEEQDDECKKKDKQKGMRYNPNTNPQNTVFFVGQAFVDVVEFRRALFNYCICHAREIVFTKNMYNRLGARCKDKSCF